MLIKSSKWCNRLSIHTEHYTLHSNRTLHPNPASADKHTDPPFILNTIRSIQTGSSIQIQHLLTNAQTLLSYWTPYTPFKQDAPSKFRTHWQTQKSKSQNYGRQSFGPDLNGPQRLNCNEIKLLVCILFLQLSLTLCKLNSPLCTCESAVYSSSLWDRGSSSLLSPHLSFCPEKKQLGHQSLNQCQTI